MERPFRKRITITLALAASVLAIIGSTVATAVIALRLAATRSDDLRQVRADLGFVEQLRAETDALARSGRRFLLSGDGKEQQRVFAIDSEIDRDRGRLRAGSTAAEAPALETALDELVAVVIRAMSSSPEEFAVKLSRFEDDLMIARNAVELAFDKLAARAWARLDRSPARQQLGRRAQWALIIAAVLGAVLTIGTAISVIRELIRQRTTRKPAGAVEQVAVARTELLATSKELRAPLVAILTESARLQALKPRDEDELRGFDTISRSAARADRLLGELVDVSALEAGMVSLRRESCCAAGLVERAVTQHRDAALDRGIRLRFEAQRTTSVSVDRGRLERALASLLGTAIAAARVGTEIAVNVSPANGGVRIVIVNSGPESISDQPVRRFEPAAAVTDNDLGLHLCKLVIEAHGGRVGIETAAAGRTYWFTLPSEPSLLR